MAAITMRHDSISRLFKRLDLPTENLTSFKLECRSRADHLVTLDVQYLVEADDIDSIEREFKSFILIEKPL